MKFPRQMVSDMHASYQRGRTLAEVGRMYGIDRGQDVAREFRRAGLEVRPRPAAKAKPPKLMPVALQAPFEGKLTPERIAELRADKTRNWGRRGMPAERAQAIVLDFQRLSSTRAVGKLWGCSGSAVHEIVARRGLSRPRKLLPSYEIGGRRYTQGKGGFLRDTQDHSKQVSARGDAPDRELLAHREVWRLAHGPIPPGHVVLILNGRKDDLRLENLECLPKSEAMSRLSSGRNGSHTSKEAELVASIDAWLAMWAKRYGFGYGVDPDDLLQVGRMQALRAARLFDPTRGAKFLTYAHRCCRSIMLREAQSLKAPVHVPVYRRQDFIVTRLELDAPVSQDEPGGSLRGEIAVEVACTDPDAADQFESGDRVEQLHAALTKLSIKEQEVLQARFFAEETLEQIGDRYGVSRERIRQIEAKALRRLRAHGGLEALR